MRDNFTKEQMAALDKWLEKKLFPLRIRYWVGIILALVAVMIALWLFSKYQEQQQIQYCQSENARWARLQSNVQAVLVQEPGETDKEFAARRSRTLTLFSGLTNVNCHDPQARQGNFNDNPLSTH